MQNAAAMSGLQASAAQSAPMFGTTGPAIQKQARNKIPGQKITGVWMDELNSLLGTTGGG